MDRDGGGDEEGGGGGGGEEGSNCGGHMCHPPEPPSGAIWVRW